MRKELIICDHCGEEIQADGDGSPLGFQVSGSVTVRGSEPKSNGFAVGVAGAIELIGPGEYCRRRCLLAAISGSIEAAEDSLNSAIR